MMRIEKLEDYIHSVLSIYSKWNAGPSTVGLWFRGQANAQWDLLPKIYRTPGESYFERELIRDFKLRAISYLNDRPIDDFEWLFIMQHYGMPTRLLDWTESYLFALFFAVLGYRDPNDAAVWVLDPWSLNLQSIDQQSVPITNHPALKDYALETDPKEISRDINAKLPAAIRPTRSTPRIIAQKGVFTIHGSIAEGLNQIQVTGLDGIFLESIVISGAQKKRLLKELEPAGVTYSVLFPELEGISKEIAFRYSKDYLDESG